ncbi:putative WD40 repeats [Lyophyllum shimeji]|uniref:WD40 repeats n=1 Tax=Lyophyllum shimeji TaxID=47721 RepID=A0A9P3PR50_LYOSH|nr:putative WD40 repeats [Lyophyllum shimeji]
MTASFLLPLTFPAPELKDRNGPKSQLLETSCSQTLPICMTSWGTVSNSPLEGGEDDTQQAGVVVGAQDGTLYLLSQINRTPVDSQPSESQLPRPISLPRLWPDSRDPSRSSTPSATSPLPFVISPRARVVSGVTAEQVEAPKNYVDFDDEPDRLKDMLQGRQPRDSREKLALPQGPSRRTSIEGSPAPSLKSSSKRKEAPKSLLSTAHSAPSSTYSSSPRDSTTEFLYDLSLWCHIIPPRSGPGRGVSCLRLLEDTGVLIVLQETGDLSVFSLQDGSCLATVTASDIPIQPPTGIEDKDAVHALWLWCHLEVYHVGETTLMLASATIDPNSPSSAYIDPEDNGAFEKSRLAIFELVNNDHFSPPEISLVPSGQWCFDGACHSVGLHMESDNSLTFFAVTCDGHFVIRGFHLLPRVPPETATSLPEKDAAPITSIPIPNPFKALKAQSVERLPLNSNGPGRVALDAERDLGEVIAGGSPAGFQARSTAGRMRGLLWSQQELTVFEYQIGYIRVLYTVPAIGIREARWTSDSTYTVLFKDRAECYMLQVVDPDNDEVNPAVARDWSTIVKSELQQTVVLGQYDAADIGSASQILTTTRSPMGARVVTAYENAGASVQSRILWQGGPLKSDTQQAMISSLLPLALDVIVQGCADGRLRQSSLIQMIGDAEKSSQAEEASEPALNGFLTGLHHVQNPRTKERFVVGGADDGSIAFWTIDHFKLRARWTLFTTCLSSVIQIEATLSSPLRGCVLCISVDGTVAVIVVDGFQFLYLVPGSSAPLSRICVGGNNLLLVYADNRARLWDVQTLEFWRSMTVEKVDELLGQGGWTELSLGTRLNHPDTALTPIPGPVYSPDVATTLVLDLERFTTESIAVAKSISTNRDQTRAILLTLERLRSLLSVFLTPGLNPDIDAICTKTLGIRFSSVSTGFVSQAAVTLYRTRHPADPWRLSGDVSAARALSIAVILGALSLFEEFSEGANTVMIFYATSLASAVGPGYQPSSLVYLARRWFDGSNEVRRSARALCDYAIACLSDEEAVEIAEHWQHHLPSLQPTAERESIHAALALFLCGYLAAEKYSLLSTSALTDISKSIALYLHDEQSLHRVLAIDLCSRGFHIWQHYIDAMEILRALFALATTSRKDSINLQNIGSQARLAVLQIASSNTPLFMTTLALDILTPPTLEHRKAVMQIVAFLIRKRPLVLQPNIPKLMEAVVKSLDPNVTTHREAVLDSATEIIGYVVKTFPTVDFHMATQRLAVGSNEGAVVMYDLKTATRLYVLEGHKKPISACSFSPDGRRLLTLSLEESVVLVWKVGSSFASFFNPGAPPRQGHGGSQPYKTINFNLGDQANMAAQGTTEPARFDWVADRSVKVKIRELVLTFST